MWGHLPETKLYTLQKMQNRAFYLVESAPFKDQIPSAQLVIKKLITYDRAVMVHKPLGEMCPEILKESLRGDLIFHNTKLAEQTICKYLNQDWQYQNRVSRTSVQRR